MFRLFLLFALVPFVELAILLRVHDFYSYFWGDGWALTLSLGFILVTGSFGAFFARRQGLAVIRNLQHSLAQGQNLGPHLVEAVLVLVGGLMLLTPGYLTDLIGFLFILPVTRRRLAKAVLSRLTIQSVGGGYQTPFTRTSGFQRPTPTSSEQVYEAEVIEILSSESPGSPKGR